MPNIGAEALVLSYTGAQCLIWSAADCARVRSIGRLCVSPIGLCSAKLATRGKAAAVPVVLNDEELWVCCAVATHWRVTVLDMRTGRAVPAASILGAAAAADRSGFIHVRRLVFADLWQRGYRCTSGLKFGCDYLSYTADASQVHAAFMVIVRRERDDGADGGGAGGEISPLDLVAKSRVATTALKICVMAYGDTRTGRVRYADVDAAGGWWTHAPTLLLMLTWFYSQNIQFYAMHRAMHAWGTRSVPDIGAWLYRHVHSLHHQARTPTAFSGIAMHPVEGLLYLSYALFPLLFAAHPIACIYIKTNLIVAAMLGHDGFESPAQGSMPHYIHHAHVSVNYAEAHLPIDWMLGTFAGTPEEARASMERRLAVRRGEAEEGVGKQGQRAAGDKKSA